MLVETTTSSARQEQGDRQEGPGETAEERRAAKPSHAEAWVPDGSLPGLSGGPPGKDGAHRPI